MAKTIINLSDPVSTLVSKTNIISNHLGDITQLNVGSANDSDIVQAINFVNGIVQKTDSADIINLIDSNYVQARQTGIARSSTLAFFIKDSASLILNEVIAPIGVSFIKTFLDILLSLDPLQTLQELLDISFDSSSLMYSESVSLNLLSVLGIMPSNLCFLTILLPLLNLCEKSTLSFEPQSTICLISSG